MKKTILSLLLILFLIPSFSQERINVIPAVQEWDSAGEVVKYNAIFLNWDKEAPEKEQLFLNRFEQELKDLNVNVVEKNAKNSLFVNIDLNYKAIGEHKNAYRIDLGRETKVEASSYKALVNASRTLLQLFSQEKYKQSFPKGLITDYPKYGKRMLLLDVARKFFTFDELKDFIKIMAWAKMNELHLHLSDNSWGGYSAYRLESEIYPELTAKDGHYTWEQIRELQDFAHSYGIVITPEIDSPGHSLAFTNVRPDLKSKWLTANYLDITNPDTYTFMEEILEEVIPHFDAPDFHLGTDEYRINRIKDDSLKYHIGNTFRKYINYFNAIVKKNGKQTRIWSGFEHMPGKTKIDKDIVIDMWETSDAQDKSKRGYQFINSTHFYTYFVPGAPYYGVDNRFIYEEWTPEIFSDKTEQNLLTNSPGLLGSKMHIWNDFGPTGYSTSEITRLSMSSILIFSEKMWGSQSQLSFEDYKKDAAKLNRIPMTNLLDRNFTKRKVIYAHKEDIHLEKEKSISLNTGIENVEYPWTLEMTVEKIKEGTKEDVLFTSELASIYSDLEYEFKSKKDTISKRGIAIVRANQTAGDSPLTSHRPQVIVFDYQIPLKRLVKIKLIGEQGKTSLYVDGQFVGSENIQMLCPVSTIGNTKGKTFCGKIKNVSIVQNSVDE